MGDAHFRTISRSFSGGIPFAGPSSPRHARHATAAPVLLIPSDLWEAITGEELNPTNIYHLLDHAVPSPDRRTPQSLHFVWMAKDRHGSRTLQQLLETGGPSDVCAIFDSLLPSLSDLVADPAANFVIQKLCDVASPAQQERLLAFFTGDIFAVIDHPISCRVLQKFIETTSKATVGRIFDAVQPRLLPLCLSQNGNHIVQRFIEALPARLDSIIALVQPHVVRLAVDNCGCRVVQRLFDKYSVDQLAPLVAEVLRAAAELATNQYGNYVIQNILEARRPEHWSALVEAFRAHFYEFSIHKFASNVIEKCIRGASRAEQIVIFAEVIGEEGHYLEDRIVTMVADKFGNFVMQRIIESGTESQQNAIYAVVYDNFDALMESPYASYVVSKLETMGFPF
jgi:hypothetical protein